jgi:hypothetical protein
VLNQAEEMKMADLRLIIEESAEEALKLQVPEIAWYRIFGFREDPFNYSPLQASNASLFVNREKEARSLTRSLMLSLRGAYGLVAIVGPEGVGKTSILNFVDSHLVGYVKSKHPELEPKIPTEHAFSMKGIFARIEADDDKQEEGPPRDNFELLLRVIRERPAYIILDDCELDVASSVSVIEKATSMAGFMPLIITVWTPSSYSRLTKEHGEFTKSLKAIEFISPLSEGYLDMVLSRRLGLSSRFANGEALIDDAARLQIASRSRGLPGVMLSLTRESFLEAAKRDDNKVTREHVASASDRLRLSSDGKTYDKLTPVEKKFAWLMVERGGQATSEDIVLVTGLSRPTCVFHLSQITAKGFLAKERKGRTVVYKLPQHIINELELKIQSEIETGAGRQ